MIWVGSIPRTCKRWAVGTISGGVRLASKKPIAVDVFSVTGTEIPTTQWNVSVMIGHQIRKGLRGNIRDVTLNDRG